MPLRLLRCWLVLLVVARDVAAAAPAPPPDSAALSRWRRQAQRELFSANDSALWRSRRVVRWARQLRLPSTLAHGYVLLGSALRNRSEYDSSLHYGQQALALFEQLHQPAGAAAAYNLMAQTYKRLGDGQPVPLLTRRGLQLALRAETAARAAGAHAELSRALLTQGIVYRDLGRLDSAEACYRQAMTVERRFRPQPSYLPVCYANYGQLLMDRDANFAAAAAYLRRAIPLYQAQGNRNGREHAYRNLSWVYRRQGRAAAAVAAADTCLRLGRASGDPHRLCNSLEASYLAYRAAGRFEQAMLLLDEWKARQDSLVSVDVTRAVAQVEAKYTAEKKEARIAQLAEANARQTRRLWSVGAGAALLVLLLGLSAWQYGIIRRTNRRLRTTNRTISEQRQRLEDQAARLTVLMQELHHRVKNNLAIVSGLLRLQANRLPDPDAAQAVRAGQQRVEAMSLIHQRLYQTDNVGRVDVRVYIHDLVDNLRTAYGYAPDALSASIDVQHPALALDQAVPLGLLLNELLTNAFKYAFADVARPALRIYFGPAAEGGTVLEVHDNGPGLPPPAAVNGRAFGHRLVASLAEQLGGQLEQFNRGGACYRLHLPAPAAATAPMRPAAVPAA